MAVFVGAEVVFDIKQSYFVLEGGFWACQNSQTTCLQYSNDSCIKMGSDERHFNISVGSADGQSHKTS